MRRIHRQRLAAALFIVVMAGCTPKVDQQKFEPLYRAGKVISGAATVGVTKLKFGEMLGQFATEVSIAKDKATNQPEMNLVRTYTDALAVYQDSATVWDAKFNPSQRSDDSEIQRIAATYGLPGGVIGDPIDYDRALQVLWTQAALKLRVADGIYNPDSLRQ